MPPSWGAAGPGCQYLLTVRRLPTFLPSLHSPFRINTTSEPSPPVCMSLFGLGIANDTDLRIRAPKNFLKEDLDESQTSPPRNSSPLLLTA